jgi:hypothetical protein
MAVKGRALLGDERSDDRRRDDPSHPCMPAARHVDSACSKCTPRFLQWVAGDVVQDRVVPGTGLGEVLTRIVDDVISTDGRDHLDVARAAYRGHLGTERLGDLHRERPYASRRPVDENLLSGPNLRLIS